MRGICLGMRKFTERYKLSALSLQELRRGMQAVTTRLADLGIEFDGHVVAQANVINAFSLWCLKLPDNEQDHIVREMLVELKAHKDSQKPLPIERLVSPAVGRKSAYAAGHRVVDVDSQSNDRIAGDVSFPKRRR